MTLLSKFWMSPAKHEEIVEELNARIIRLESDYVELARSVITEREVRITAERARESLRQLRADQGGVVVAFGSRLHMPPRGSFA